MVLLLVASIGLEGCARAIILHPIDKEDIMEMKQGEPYTSDRDGYFLSDYYLEEIVKAKVE